MFDLGWSELLVIGVVTILIFGPKELPVVYRTVTQWLGKARAVAREFQNTLDDVAREAELDKLRNSIRDAKPDLGEMMDPSGSLDGLFDDPEPGISPAGPRPPQTPTAPAVDKPATVNPPQATTQAAPAAAPPSEAGPAPATAADGQGGTPPRSATGGSA